jgi:hypothetical protein
VFKIDVNKVVEALEPYGPIPIVAVITGLAAFAALSEGSDPWAVCVIAISVLGTVIWGQERKAELRKKELEVDFDASLRRREILDRLEHRQRMLRRPSEPTLFDEGGDAESS